MSYVLISALPSLRYWAISFSVSWSATGSDKCWSPNYGAKWCAKYSSFQE